MNQLTASESKNWLSYLMDSLVNAGTMPSWEALEYVTSNLIGQAPNPHLHQSKSPYETIQQLVGIHRRKSSIDKWPLNSEDPAFGHLILFITYLFTDPLMDRHHFNPAANHTKTKA